jgi:AraC-like DNA-binding protein
VALPVRVVIVHPSAFRRLCRAKDRLSVDVEAAVTAVAREAGLSPYHFIRLFAAVFGTTPHQLRTRERLERAKRLLLRDHSVTEVCMEIGFSSLGSFSELFHRRVGVPPSAYRRRLVAVPRALISLPGCFGLMTQLPPRIFREA